MSENLTEQDVRDLASMGIDAETADEVTQRSLFELWRELLSNVPTVAAEAIPMVVAHKVVNSWPRLSYQDTAAYHRIYHEYLGTLSAPLEELISAHPDVLEYAGSEDNEHNHDHYVRLLVAWHLGFDQLEASWLAEHPESHIQLAAMIDARGFVFSATGLAGHLDAIQFQLSDEEFAAALEVAKEAQ